MAQYLYLSVSTCICLYLSVSVCIYLYLSVSISQTKCDIYVRKINKMHTLFTLFVSVILSCTCYEQTHYDWNMLATRHHIHAWKMLNAVCTEVTS